jgi:desulfoferrodoxin-like iron-binding protein
MNPGGIRRMANEAGKRYICRKCGTEFIVTRAGKGELKCCGQPMELKK